MKTEGAEGSLPGAGGGAELRLRQLGPASRSVPVLVQWSPKLPEL